MNLKQLSTFKYARLLNLFMNEVKPSEDSLYLWKHEEKNYIIAFYEGCIYDIVEVLE